MNCVWNFTPREIRKVYKLCNNAQEKPNVVDRVRKNVLCQDRDLTQDNFWNHLVICLLTAGGRKSDKRAVLSTIKRQPLALSLPFCYIQKDNLYIYLQGVLKRFEGIKGLNAIHDHLFENFVYLDQTKWAVWHKIKTELFNSDNSKTEREMAELIADTLKGFNPRLSRELLEETGLTKYEIPLNSKFLRWFNKFGFPMPLSTKMLHDRECYNFIQDSVQSLCKAAEIYPCVLSAVIASHYYLFRKTAKPKTVKTVL